MATLAILDESLVMQHRERPDELTPIDVVWTGTDASALRVALPELRPTILALDMELLGDDPLSHAERLGASAGARLVLLLHRFAPREVLRDITRRGARPVKAPIRLSALRTHMTSVIVREILGDDAQLTPPAGPACPVPDRRGARIPPPAAPSPATSGLDGIPPPRFSRAQLARLAEIQSSVKCECPNHLSELLQQLGAFEEYSRACASRDDADARVHAMLARSTARARTIVEDALAQLLVHERIVL